MGFFDKIKKMVGKTGVKLEYKWIENPFTFTDPMIKATILVKAEAEQITVLGITGTFVARRTNSDGEEEEIILGEATENVDDCASIDRDGQSVPEFPHTIAAGEEGNYGYFVGSEEEMDLANSLGKWGVSDAASAKIGKVKFFFVGDVDIKETVGMFDPSLEQEINVI